MQTAEGDMSANSEADVHRSRNSIETKRDSGPVNNAITDHFPQQTPTEGGSSIPSRRTEIFRRVLPRSRHSFAAAPRSITPGRKHQHRVANPILSSDLPKRRVAFPRAIISLFHIHHSREHTSHSTRPPTHSTASSYLSRKGLNSTSDSLPSLGLVSPGTFLFSGPSLRSLSVSVNTSISQLSYLTENPTGCRSLRRVRSRSFSVGNSFAGDAILEPSVENSPFRTLSDMMLKSAMSSESSFRMLDGEEQKLQAFPLQACPEKPLDNSQLDTILAHRSTLYLHQNQRDTSQMTCSSKEAVKRPRVSPEIPISHLPHELLWLIYDYLGPEDFNSARHTCRTWIRASLDRRMLLKMLRRGGWESHTESGADDKGVRNLGKSSAKFIGEVQFLSWRLAREYAILSSRTRKASSQSKCSFVDVSHVDFTELENGTANKARNLGSTKNICLLFNISVCGRYLLVARDTIIYVYELQDNDMVAFTSVVCPRRVLSMTMDASSGRNTVAALLECRMGMVCEIQHSPAQTNKTPADSREGSREDRCQSHSRVYIKESEIQPATGVASSVSGENELHQSTGEGVAPESIEVQSNNEVFTLLAINHAHTHEQSFINHTWNIALRALGKSFSTSTYRSSTHSCPGTVPVEGSASTFYRHLCSEEDPPRSVSICPQRLCVAFGCSTSIELHWIDALAGHSLSRWFPLTAPSDHLYFLAPRPGFESAQRLRLISSAAHPDQRPALGHNSASHRPVLKPFGSNFRFGSNLPNKYLPKCDHYCAVPLSDGHHVLFTDPLTGSLYMGCDAPFDRPTKLIRKVRFIPPPVRDSTPRHYTAAFDMSWGARIVVAFGEDIFLYSVPSDICKLSREEQKARSSGIYATPLFCRENRESDHWLNWLDEQCNADRCDDHSVWPVAIRGTAIATLPDLCKLAIHTKPNLSIWAFTMDAQCKVWQLRNSVDSFVRTDRHVCQNGLVHNACTIDGASCSKEHNVSLSTYFSSNPCMRDPSYEFTADEGVDDLDGLCLGPLPIKRNAINCSQQPSRVIPKALSAENDNWVDFLDVRGCDAWFNENGDVTVVPSNHSVQCFEDEVFW